MLDASVPCQPGIWVTNPTHNIACNTLTYVFAPLGLPAQNGRRTGAHSQGPHQDGAVFGRDARDAALFCGAAQRGAAAGGEVLRSIRARLDLAGELIGHGYQPAGDKRYLYPRSESGVPGVYVLTGQDGIERVYIITAATRWRPVPFPFIALPADSPHSSLVSLTLTIAMSHGACCTIAFGNVVMTCFGAFRC